jgi:general secretion pathway protein D
MNDTEAKSLSGYPGLLKIPILKYLFGQDNRQRQTNEVVFAIIPHIIRGYDTNEDNLREVDLGSGTTVTYRKAETK